MSHNVYPGTLAHGGEWLELAVCKADPDAMHPDNNEAGIAYAKRICASCPVRRECLEDALRTGDNDHGIRGGLRPNERRDIAKMRAELRKAAKSQPKPVPKKRQPAKCGTRGGYRKHLREKTPICAPCRQANTDADNRLRRTGTTKAAV